MTHELKKLIEQALVWQKKHYKLVLATVVAMEGSSYRRPGVRMLLNDQGESFGAVSGGCVEKEVHRQALDVFESRVPKIMSYDGRLRLGCEGIIHLLLEPLELSEELLMTFNDFISSRRSFSSRSFFSLEAEDHTKFGTDLLFDGNAYGLSKDFKATDEVSVFTQEFPPLFRFWIFGAEHDAVTLCKAAATLGWEVTVVASPDEQKTIDYFPGAANLRTPNFDELEVDSIDKQTALILMTHSLSKDVQYLIALSKTHPIYFGLLGPAKRREQLINHLLEHKPDTDLAFIEKLRGPAGINIGAENSKEIAVSVLAEILSVIRNQEPIPLSVKKGRIHE